MSGNFFSAVFALAVAITPAAADVFEIKPDGSVVVISGAMPGGGVAHAAGQSPGKHSTALRARTNKRAVPSIAYASLIEAAAVRHGLDPALVDAIAYVESRYQPTAVSPAGAVGFMQIMPATAADLGVENLTDPRQNIEAGAAYLRAMLDAFDNNIEYALAAYNAGPTAVRRHGGVPPFRATQDYVRRVLDRLAAMSPADSV